MSRLSLILFFGRAYEPDLQLEWNNPDVDGLIQFLVTEKGFRYLSSLSTRSPC